MESEEGPAVLELELTTETHAKLEFADHTKQAQVMGHGKGKEENGVAYGEWDVRLED